MFYGQPKKDSAFDYLKAEFIEALAKDPQTKICTPGFTDHQTAVADVILDNFHGEKGDANLHELLRIVAGCAAGEDMQLRASAWIASNAIEHATFHENDYEG